MLNLNDTILKYLLSNVEYYDLVFSKLIDGIFYDDISNLIYKKMKEYATSSAKKAGIKEVALLIDTDP